MSIHFVSYGTGHGPAPTATITYDVSGGVLRNPHHDPAMRHLTGLDEVVYRHVLATPGAGRLAAHAAATATALWEDTGADIVVGVACIGGRHRSVGMARRAHELVTEAGIAATIEHRDVHLPVLPSVAHADSTDPATVRETEVRRAADLEHIHTYYGFGRLGIRVAVGDRVRHADWEGTVVDTAGQYLRVRFDGDTAPSTCHAVANMSYLAADGSGRWISPAAERTDS
ncbi:hypothetical protein GT354_18365 [Streptomyces sp. SID3343]|nr:hypothetical protein [Streptomyces sp. SID3343]